MENHSAAPVSSSWNSIVLIKNQGAKEILCGGLALYQNAVFRLANDRKTQPPIPLNESTFQIEKALEYVPFSSGPCEAPGVSSSSPFQEMTWKSNDQTMSRFEDKTFDYGFPTPGKKNVRVIEEETCFSSAVWSSSR
ncbi:hypothetical protein RvY_18768-2 [Ramazzottius varieornatus]|uniref:Uncharacterized protein n=1 Tax=Ramazzottius varieornatus TaxID=947166 RepID=A0A1D1W785_RAMVA|nr:hypothetical protein RvY_18768-2 [Ramazzottius varieornatus]